MIERIAVNPRVCHGKPCVRGTRIMVTLVLELLEAGYAFGQIIEAYPQLVEDDIRSCVDYARRVIENEEVYLLPTRMPAYVSA